MNLEEDNGIDRAGKVGAAIGAVAESWALAGGAVLALVILINVMSVLGGIFWKPFPGDFEITEVGVAVAAFAFLPYCQSTGANVTADIFTAKLSARWIAAFGTLASVAAILFSLILFWRMYAGMLSQKEYGYTTAILQFPVWIAYVPILISLILLFAAAVCSLLTAGERAVTGKAA